MNSPSLGIRDLIFGKFFLCTSVLCLLTASDGQQDGIARDRTTTSNKLRGFPCASLLLGRGWRCFACRPRAAQKNCTENALCSQSALAPVPNLGQVRHQAIVFFSRRVFSSPLKAGISSTRRHDTPKATLQSQFFLVVSQGWPRNGSSSRGPSIPFKSHGAPCQGCHVLGSRRA